MISCDFMAFTLKRSARSMLSLNPITPGSRYSVFCSVIVNSYWCSYEWKSDVVEFLPVFRNFLNGEL